VSKATSARRYADAAFELATESNTYDRWLADVRTIGAYFGDKRLAFILNEPNIAFARKEQVVRDLLGNTVSKDALGLALLMAERQQVELAPLVVRDYEQLNDQHLNQEHATLITARPMDDATLRGLRSQLEASTGKRILLDQQVDPSILGGAMIRVGDTLIDGSVKRKLRLLRQQIVQGGPASENGATPAQS
jgi:F-type H+-transporting ATPase subunit delta